MHETVNLKITPSIQALIRGSEKATYMNSVCPQDAHVWKQKTAQKVLSPGDELLHGGHRNLVVKKGGSNQVDIYWRQSDIRWPQIIKGILIEDAMSRHFDIPGRQLIDPEVPVSMTEDGLLVTHTQYTEGENRYPYNSLEIDSAIGLMGKMHGALQCISFEGESHEGNNQWIHGDFGRANVLFRPGTAEAIAVIDYENAVIGPITQDLGRFISLLLVDTKLPNGLNPYELTEELQKLFLERINLPLELYPFDRSKGQILQQRHDAIVYAAGYLLNEDYGSLNDVKNLAIDWLKQQFQLTI